MPATGISKHLCVGTTPTVQQTMIFDRVVPDQVNRAKTTQRHASGKSINVARVLHLLGQRSCAVVPLGGDTGQFMRNELAGLGMQLRVVDVAAPTRTCVTMIDQSSGVVTELVEESAAMNTVETKQMLDSAIAELAGMGMMILSGSLAPGVAVDFYAECCRTAAERNVPVILDARGEALLLALRHRPLVVKPNRSELAATMNRPLDSDQDLHRAMIELHDLGAQWVLITHGREGATLCNGKNHWRIPTIDVEAISAIGSGDAFSAGLAAGITSGREIPDACRLGAACAAANTLVPGSGLLKMEDVWRLESRVKVERINEKGIHPL